VIECLHSIAKNEGIELTESGARAIWEIYGGDLRRGINALQATSVLRKIVTEKEIRAIVARAGLNEVKEMLNLALAGDFMKAREKLYEFLMVRGIAGTDLLHQIHQVIYSLDLDDEERAKLVHLIGEYDFRLLEGANEDIQLSAFLAQLALMKRR
jgi:replication factor C small subunit